MLTSFNQYQIQEVIGRGGMGVVYKALDTRIHRYVAIKELILNEAMDEKEKSGVIKRFYREAQSAGSLSHPNIVTIYEAGAIDNTHYMVMELLKGKSLKELLNEKPRPSLDKILLWTKQICSALTYAHRQGVVHRDIKPANIIVDEEDGIKIADFGIARISSATAVTQEGSLLGTILYMSPEQVRGDANLDGRSDIFSLGVVLYEMATKRLPFQGEGIGDTIFKIVGSEPEPPSIYNEVIHPHQEKCLLKALRKNPDERYQIADQLYEDLVHDGSEISDKETIAGNNIRYCVNCGQALTPEIKFCTRCSTVIWVKDKTDPHSSEDHLNFGDVYVAKGEIEKAVNEYQKAVAINPLDTIALYCLATAYQKMGMTSSAINVYQQILRLNPPDKKLVAEAEGGIQKLKKESAVGHVE